MGKRDDELTISSLTNVWSAQSNPAAGTTCVANVNASISPRTTHYRHMVGNVTYSLRNNTAAAVTATLSLRDNAIGGNVLAQWEFIVGVAAAVQGAFPGVNIPGIRGDDVFLEFGTPASSVVQKCSMAGWTDEMVNG